jgi:alkanesulfonate monooxygenase SsuD/methylene tetrahydromethanopterin reductase-like flavin-dependent oxidoreductase (luciferase family)
MPALRVGLFSYLDEIVDPTEPYEMGMKLYEAADELGFDSVWIAQHHFGNHGGVPSPLVFLMGLAERVHRATLGTAVVTLSFENGLKVVEDAATFNAIHPGRLELGIGTGGGAGELFELFGRTQELRRDYYNEGSELILRALEGEPLTSNGQRLYPPAPELRQRIWEAASSPAAAAFAGARGNGLMLSRVALGVPYQESGPTQVALVDAYESAARDAGYEPRIGMSRTVIVCDAGALDPETVINEVTAAYIEGFGGNLSSEGFSRDQLRQFSNLHFGTPAEVVASLSEEPLIGRITDLIVQTQPAELDFAERRRSLELLITEVVPALSALRAAPLEAAR